MSDRSDLSTRRHRLQEWTQRGSSYGVIVPAEIVSDYEATLCELEMLQNEHERLLARVDTTGEPIASRTASTDGGTAQAGENEDAHGQCHDVVCNGDRRYPRGEVGHCCSCATRQQGGQGEYLALKSALAAAEARLATLREEIRLEQLANVAAEKENVRLTGALAQLQEQLKTERWEHGEMEKSHREELLHHIRLAEQAQAALAIAQEERDSSQRLTKLAIDNEVRWMRLHEAAKAEIVRLTAALQHETEQSLLSRLPASGDPIGSDTRSPQRGEAPTCEHGTAMDVHCCNCHSGFLFDVQSCVCDFGPEPAYWRCRTCGCVWRDNHNGTVSLGSQKQTSCEKCEGSTPLECEPLYLKPLPPVVEAPPRETRTDPPAASQQEQA